MNDSGHLQWIHDRLVNVHEDEYNVDFLHRLRKIISNVKTMEFLIEAYNNTQSN